MQGDAYGHALDDHRRGDGDLADGDHPDLGVLKQSHEGEGEAPAGVGQLGVAHLLKAAHIGEGVGLEHHLMTT